MAENPNAFNLRLMTLNIGKLKGKPSADERYEYLMKAMRQERCDLYLVQECPQGIRRKHDKEKYPGPEYNLKVSIPDNGDVTAVIYKQSQFTQAKIRTVTAGMRYYDTTIKQNGRFKHRACAVMFTTNTENPQDFLVGSWHGPENTSDRDKRDMFIKLLDNLMSIISSRDDNLPVIVGGDFNWDIDNCPKDRALQPNKYEAPANRKEKNLIDYFLTNIDATLEECRAIDIDTINEHYPVVARVRSGTQSLQDTLEQIHDSKREVDAGLSRLLNLINREGSPLRCNHLEDLTAALNNCKNTITSLENLASMSQLPFYYEHED